MPRYSALHTTVQPSIAIWAARRSPHDPGLAAARYPPEDASAGYQLLVAVLAARAAVAVACAASVPSPDHSLASAKTRVRPARRTRPSATHGPIRAGARKLVLISTVGRNSPVLRNPASDSGRSSMATMKPPWMFPKWLPNAG